jgi:hypothetical protein
MLAKLNPQVFRPWPALSFRYSIFHRPRAPSRHFHTSITVNGHGDLNNSYAARPQVELAPNPAYSGRSFAISKDDDEPDIRERYRPFLLDGAYKEADWVARLELSTALKMVESEVINRGHDRLRILVLYGSMRSRSVSHSSSLLLLSLPRLCPSFVASFDGGRRACAGSVTSNYYISDTLI